MIDLSLRPDTFVRFLQIGNVIFPFLIYCIRKVLFQEPLDLLLLLFCSLLHRFLPYLLHILFRHAKCRSNVIAALLFPLKQLPAKRGDFSCLTGVC